MLLLQQVPLPAGAADRLCAGPPQAEEADLVYAAICGAGRALGYVCAPSLFQLVVARCAGQTADMAVYRRNRDLFLDALRCPGYTCAQPEGLLPLPRSLEPDAAAFCERAGSMT